MKVLVTCPPMLGMIDQFRPVFEAEGVELTTPDVVQTLSVDELKAIVPEHDGWIIGDDPANKDVLAAGHAGRLRAAVKWGIGTDNVDFDACRRLGIEIVNTPNMFGHEVADIAMGYVIGLARHTFEIDRGVRSGEWPKPRGISLEGKSIAIVGMGDIGRQVARRALVAGMKVQGYDPFAGQGVPAGVEMMMWPDGIGVADFIVIACALTDGTLHMLNEETLAAAKRGVRVVNISRGPVIKQRAIEAALQSGHVHSAALDVFEVEPLPMDSPLRDHPRCVFGSHNASNTVDAVERTSLLAIDKLLAFLNK